ncbi:MAG: hypothetical protein ABSH44_00490 [Bryobacteraceae bacterium]|jgi:hypothetical protein
MTRKPASDSIASQLSLPGVDFQAIVARVVRTPERIDALFEGLGSKTASVKHGSAKVLRLVSEQAPDLLYPRFDFFVRLLGSDNAFLRWGATKILGNLAAVDRESKFEKVFDQYFAPVSGPEMVGAANAIASAAQIALAKPRLADRIVKEILKAGRASYQTRECRNVVMGHAIQSFDRFFSHVQNRKPVLAFVRRQLANPRQATRRKAEKFLKRWG